jgi:hypothetical protein
MASAAMPVASLVTPPASRRIIATVAVAYPSLSCGKLEPSILSQVDRLGKFHPPSACWDATRSETILLR